MTDQGELDLLCHKFDQQREEINFAWNANAGVAPTESFPDDTKVKGDGEEVFIVEEIAVKEGVGAVGDISPVQERGGGKLEYKPKEEDFIAQVVITE